VCGVGDMREILSRESRGDERARLAVDLFCYRIKKYVGAYLAILGRVDAVVFTGGIGENSAEVRQASCAGLDFLGITVDAQANQSSERQKDISTKGSKTRVLVIPTNEELVIALDTMEIVKARNAAKAAS